MPAFGTNCVAARTRYLLAEKDSSAMADISSGGEKKLQLFQLAQPSRLFCLETSSQWLSCGLCLWREVLKKLLQALVIHAVEIHCGLSNAATSAWLTSSLLEDRNASSKVDRIKASA